ncbi:hypothetical protein QWJ34_22305 [Saccharibacillus sp. CPCC 101409]|uniref:hypothetical protein n=1 Tax=Saccharibacillus sp. CPCC 101409 TaxID=3058041 RepID=UPI0026732AB2|nr:hypothetical protein [Saccharibacillus sp. CPCC 101409]MDO3412514.1 hypothetical protein [Saccharibacillus sp. CPCC 101409]
MKMIRTESRTGRRANCKSIPFAGLLLGTVLVLSACDQEESDAPPETESTLSSAVTTKAVASSGAALSWDTFRDYPFEDIGSGLYIRQYELGGGHKLVVSGKSLDKAPERIVWINGDGAETEIRDSEGWQHVREAVGLNR